MNDPQRWMLRHTHKYTERRMRTHPHPRYTALITTPEDNNITMVPSKRGGGGFKWSRDNRAGDNGEDAISGHISADVRCFAMLPYKSRWPSGLERLL